LSFAVLLAGFAVVVVGGYRLHWAWTGFEGNTVRDWLQLLVVPFLLPATLAWFAARREAGRETDREADRDAREADREAAEVPRQVTIPEPGEVAVSGAADPASS
jgi:hypothetical protein